MSILFNWGKSPRPNASPSVSNNHPARPAYTSSSPSRSPSPSLVIAPFQSQAQGTSSVLSPSASASTSTATPNTPFDASGAYNRQVASLLKSNSANFTALTHKLDAMEAQRQGERNEMTEALNKEVEEQVAAVRKEIGVVRGEVRLLAEQESERNDQQRQRGLELETNQDASRPIQELRDEMMRKFDEVDGKNERRVRDLEVKLVVEIGGIKALLQTIVSRLEEESDCPRANGHHHVADAIVNHNHAVYDLDADLDELEESEEDEPGSSEAGLPTGMGMGIGAIMGMKQRSDMGLSHTYDGNGTVNPRDIFPDPNRLPVAEVGLHEMNVEMDMDVNVHGDVDVELGQEEPEAPEAEQLHGQDAEVDGNESSSDESDDEKHSPLARKRKRVDRNESTEEVETSGTTSPLPHVGSQKEAPIEIADSDNESETNRRRSHRPRKKTSRLYVELDVASTSERLARSGQGRGRGRGRGRGKGRVSERGRGRGRGRGRSASVRPLMKRLQGSSTRLRVSDGVRRGEGEWPNRGPCSTKGIMQEINCDACGGRCHWSCAGLLKTEHALPETWNCADCVIKLAADEDIDLAPPDRCIRGDCVLRLKRAIEREEGDEQEYHVDRIIGRRATERVAAPTPEDPDRRIRIFEYLVSWLDYPLAECTWEPAGNVPASAVEDFITAAERYQREGDILRLKSKTCLLPVAREHFDPVSGDPRGDEEEGEVSDGAEDGDGVQGVRDVEDGGSKNKRKKGADRAGRAKKAGSISASAKGARDSLRGGDRDGPSDDEENGRGRGERAQSGEEDGYYDERHEDDDDDDDDDDE